MLDKNYITQKNNVIKTKVMRTYKKYLKKVIR